MSFISKLLGKLFGSKQEQPIPDPAPAPVDDYAARQNKIIEWQRSIEQKIRESLKEKGELHFSWESGHDEAFVSFDAFNEAESDFFYQLDEYIIDKLNIPDAGEFQMNGSGTIYIGNGLVRAKFRSTIKGVIDYDEETEEEIYDEEETDSGDVVLFTL